MLSRAASLTGHPGGLNAAAACGSVAVVSGLHGWETYERVLDSGGLESRQLVRVNVRAVEASEAGARWLGLTYWQAVDSFTRGAIRATGAESRQLVLVDKRAVEASEAGARWLGLTYWQAVDSLTRGAIRASWGDQGGRLRLVGGATLLRFGLPELRYSDALVSCRYAIEGGLLALRPGGSVTLAQRVEGTEHELSVTVEEYLPSLAARAGAPWWTGAVYAKVQSPFHAAVSRRYFELLVRGRQRESDGLRSDGSCRTSPGAAARGRTRCRRCISSAG